MQIYLVLYWNLYALQNDAYVMEMTSRNLKSVTAQWMVATDSEKEKKSTIENRQKAKTSNEKRHPWSIEGIHV